MSDLRFLPVGPMGATPARVVYRIPGRHFDGEFVEYVGRKFNAKTRAFEATSEPESFADPSGMGAGDERRRVANKMIRACRQGDLWPADKATAARCGVAFTELSRDEGGEWVPKALADKKRGPSPQPAPAPAPPSEPAAEPAAPKRSRRRGSDQE